MAKRPVFISGKNKVLLKEVEFNWHAGFAPSQKKKSIKELHKNFLEVAPSRKVLEISSKSDIAIGVSLSAFNLLIEDNGEMTSFESIFQGSKRFENGGPYSDLIEVSPRLAKRDPRLKNSGDIIGFSYKKEEWPNEPKTFFYDYMYIKAVAAQPQLLEELVTYDAFTDIEFNPKKSINCQAKAAALLVTLYRKEILYEIIENREMLLSFYEVENTKVNNIKEEDSSEQMKLF
ncbi:hypothetical protein [uncultured Planococcus sp.]|uniref:DarT1-associated NADAR antitoxin family protein n=1 Tax=uncultured Planococcus sp. TaxID=337815 RepID=UPI00261F97DC|nr:hypothetical protein [uncultured Planococcus sp.]